MAFAAPNRAKMEQLLREGITALNQKRAADARKAIAGAIQAGADNAPTWLGMAMACQADSDLPAALEAADKSIAHEPRNPSAYLIKADVNLEMGDKRAAAAYYRETLIMAPPPAQQSAKLVEDLRRAEAAVKRLQTELEAHLESAVADLSADDSADAVRVRRSVDLLLGRRQVYYPEPHNYLLPDLPVKEFYDAADFNWVPALEAKTDAICAELEALRASGDLFGAYVTGEENRPTHDTHGMKGNTDWGAYYLWYNGAPVAENQARCPETTKAMQAVPLVFSEGRSPNVLFSRLKPGATIPPHTGMTNTRLICHLPLIIPPGCGFRVGNDTREWQKGKVWMFDDTINHEAWNKSDQERVILLFEIWKPEISLREQELIKSVFAAVDSY